MSLAADIGISSRTAARWKAKGADFNSAGVLLAWAEYQRRLPGALRIQSRYLERLRALAAGEPPPMKSGATDGAPAVSASPAPAAVPLELVDLKEVEGMGIAGALEVAQKSMAIAATEKAAAYMSDDGRRRALADAKFADAAEALRKLEKDVAPILLKSGQAWPRGDVKSAIAEAFGRVRGVLDGLIRRHPDLARDIEASLREISENPILGQCAPA